MKTLSLKGGCHKLEIYCNQYDNNIKEVFIICTDDNSTSIEDDYPELETACYLPDIEEIDLIIEKLQEAKKFLKNERV